jgi:hypothetical protein
LIWAFPASRIMRISFCCLSHKSVDFYYSSLNKPTHSLIHVPSSYQKLYFIAMWVFSNSDLIKNHVLHLLIMSL